MSARAKSPTKPGAKAAPAAAGANPLEAKLKEAQDKASADAQQRNYAQLERDKILSFWEVTKAELADVKAQLRVQAREAEDAAERAADALRAVTHQMKHMAHEQSAQVAALHLDRETAVKVAHDEFRRVEEQLNAEKLELVAQLQAARSAASATVHDVKLEAAREVSSMRTALDADASAAKAAAAAVVSSERAAADARRLAELEEAAQRRSKQVEALQEAHGAALAEVKRFYDDTSGEQLATIKRLKDEVAALRTREAALESQVSDLNARCGATSEQLAKAMQEVGDLRPVAAEADKNKASAAAATARAAKAEKQLKNVEYELEVKTQLAAALKAERDELERALDAAEVSSRKPGRILTATGSPAVSRPGSSASTVAGGDAAAHHLGGMSLR